MSSLASLMWLTLALLAVAQPATQPAEGWVQTAEGAIGMFHLLSAPFPHASRSEGFTTRDGVIYPAAAHYRDNTVGIVIPEGFKPRDETDFVVHFHGHKNNVANVLAQFGLASQLRQSGVNAILIICQGPLDVPDSGFGKLEEADGLKNLLAEVAERLKADGKTPTAQIGKVVLTAHSGGYRATAQCVARGGLTDHITDVLLFDATYGGLDSFADYAAGGNGRRVVTIFTEHLASENYMLLTMLSKRSVPADLWMDTDLTAAALLPRRPIFIHTRELAHNDVVSKRDYFAMFLKTSALPQR